MELHRRKILNSIVAKPVCGIWKKVFREGSSNGRFSVEENLPKAPVPPVNPRNIPKIAEEDLLLDDDEAQSQVPELVEAQDLEDLVSEPVEAQDLEDLDSELLQDEDLKDAVVYKSTKLFLDEGKWKAEPHVRVWSNRP